MSEILRDASIEKLIKAIEENLSAWIPFFGLLGQSYSNHPIGVKRSITNLPFSLFNSVMDAQLVPDQVDPTIEIIVSDAKAHNVSVLWWIGPSTQPIDLGKSLEKNGFTFDEKSPGMAVDLRRLNESLPKPEGFSIHLAHDAAAHKQWSTVMELGFGVTSPNEISVNAWCRILQQANSETIQAYTGMLDNRPVATSLLFLAAGVAGVYCVATIPDARRKGIGALLTQYPLLQARSRGYQVGVLQSSEMGLGVYHSLGFQEYCDINTYLWKPEKNETG